MQYFRSAKKRRSNHRSVGKSFVCIGHFERFVASRVALIWSYNELQRAFSAHPPLSGQRFSAALVSHSTTYIGTVFDFWTVFGIKLYAFCIDISAIYCPLFAGKIFKLLLVWSALSFGIEYGFIFAQNSTQQSYAPIGMRCSYALKIDFSYMIYRLPLNVFFFSQSFVI
ncbi:hypothetical protein O6H91_07G022000 [Diphasiastrum complanatum]|uniref:Uncharacterized protein n=1 Tax=Diphasiastrum complanatum TaxID=34168 RepID=A0ACC2D3G0_DIPCM|nr:hypothetical protein O6H91_07G022000 [Diphasiastrum complanatum]